MLLLQQHLLRTPYQALSDKSTFKCAAFVHIKIDYKVAIFLFNKTKMENSGLTPEQLALFKAGFLQCSDGSLMRWSPNQEPDPLIVGMMGLHISEKGTSSKN